MIETSEFAHKLIFGYLQILNRKSIQHRRTGEANVP